MSHTLGTTLRTTNLKKGLVLLTVRLSDHYYRTVLLDKKGNYVVWPDGSEHQQYDNWVDAITMHEEIARKLAKTF